MQMIRKTQESVINQLKFFEDLKKAGTTINIGKNFCTTNKIPTKLITSKTITKHYH